MLLAFGFGMLREFSDRVFRTSQQVEDDLQSDCIAILPAVNEASNRNMLAVGKNDVPIFGGPRTIVRAERYFRHVIGSLISRFTVSERAINGTRGSFGVNKSNKGAASSPVSAASMNDAPSGPRMIVRDHSLLWHVIDSPFSRFSESIRGIKIAADLFGVSKSNKVIAVTSSLPNEGKTTVSTALAQLMAHSGSRAILLDCDLRNPELSRKLAPNASVGLLEFLSGKASLEEVTWTDSDTS